MAIWSSNTTESDAAYVTLALWLYKNYESVYAQYSIYSDMNARARTYTNLRLWVNNNHPYIIPMIDLLEAAQCE